MPNTNCQTRLLPQERLFQVYNVDKHAYRRSKLKWSTLRAIFEDYSSWRSKLLPVGAFVADTLAQQTGVHAVKYRIKDAEHLVEKIIRLSSAKGSPCVTPSNYRDAIKDFVGVRALYLFKEDWSLVHSSIMNNWELKTRPVAKVRDSDPAYVLNEFKAGGCDIEPQKSGYTSVHYEIHLRLAKTDVVVELQTRSLFEEAWAEASHHVAYPYYHGVDMIERYLVILSKTAGMSDSLASATKMLRELAHAQSIGKPAAFQQTLKRKVHERLEPIKGMLPALVDILVNPMMMDDDQLQRQLASARTMKR